jgi:uncharacterized protein
MIFDVHAHCGPWFFAMTTGELATNSAQLDEFGVDVQVVSPVAGITYDPAANAGMVDALAADPRIYGYVVANPRLPDQARHDLDRLVGRPEFIGVKIHESYADSGPSERSMLRLWDVLAEVGLPVLFHTWGPEVLELPQILESRPGLRVIAAHMGGSHWWDGVEAASRSDRLWLEPSCSIIDRGKLELAVERLGVDRLLFGTDATLIHPAWSLGMFDELDLDDADLHRVMWTNAVDLFGVSGPRN